jgi:hypothetical protein
MKYSRASQLPDGVAIATLVSINSQCGIEDCDSWKTIGIEMLASTTEGQDALLRIPLCMKHLGEFIDENILKAPGSVLDAEDLPDCGDPDCPVHGYLRDEDEDEDDDDDGE